MNMQVTVKDAIREKVDLFTSNAQLLYAFLLSGWVIFNLLMLWIKYQKEHEALRKARIDREIRELELKKLKDERD